MNREEYRTSFANNPFEAAGFESRNLTSNERDKVLADTAAMLENARELNTAYEKLQTQVEEFSAQVETLIQKQDYAEDKSRELQSTIVDKDVVVSFL